MPGVAVIYVLACDTQLPYHLPYMRAALLLVVALGAPTIAHAENKKTVVWQDRVIMPHQGTTALANISHKLFVNRCVGGCVVQPTGFMQDDSRTNKSSIADSPVTLTAYSQGDAKWNALIDCVKQTFIPFNVEIVTVDPGPSVAHFETMVTGGSSQELNPQLSAGGVAPFISCNATYNNGLSFVFHSTDLEFACGAVAQEAAHVWGLDHELNKDDPMTYLQLGSLKRFQNADAQCHDSNIQPIAQCRCGNAKQNSYQYMLTTFGASNLPAPTLVIATPVEGQWVKPGFPIRAELTSVITGTGGGALQIDGMQTATASATAPLVFNAPMTIAGGDHTVTVTATDGGARSATGSVHVKVTAGCSATMPCGNNTYCIGGFCVPGSDVDGGLGATCTTNDNCITGQCGTADGESLCTGGCDATGECPSGYECLGDGAAGVCWPSSGDGGCSTSGSGGAPFALLAGLGFAAIVLRRRR